MSDERTRAEKLSDLADSAEAIGSKHEAEVATVQFLREVAKNPTAYFAGPLLRAFDKVMKEQPRKEADRLSAARPTEKEEP